MYERNLGQTPKGHPRRERILYALGYLWYEQEREIYSNKEEKYRQIMECKDKGGCKDVTPIAPVPSYENSRKYYIELIRDYPKFDQRPRVLYTLGMIFTKEGDFDNAAESYKELLEKFPKYENIHKAKLRLGEYHYLNREYVLARGLYEEVMNTSMGKREYALALYRLASCYFNTGMFKESVDWFFEYVDGVDKKQLDYGDFREEALEFMAISFSEMENGAEKAVKFLKKKGGRPYEDFIVYTIGLKNNSHDNPKEAVKSLTLLLKKYPMYIEAPLALGALIETYLKEKKLDTVNTLRQIMVDKYGPGSAWAKTYDSEKDRLKKVFFEVKNAAATIPMYYYKTMDMAQHDAKHAKDPKVRKLAAKKASVMIHKAISSLEKYMVDYKSEVWNVYTFHYLLADLYSDSLINDYRQAAKHYDWVSRSDTSGYPDRNKPVDPEDAEYDVRNQKKSIHELIANIVIKPEDAAYASLTMFEKIMSKKLKEMGLVDSNTYKAYQTPEVQEYLKKIAAFRKRFPGSQYANDLIFFEASINFDAKKYTDAVGGFIYIINHAKDDKKLYLPALKNLAITYLNNKNFELAIETYKKYLFALPPGSPDKATTVKAIATSMFAQAHDLQEKKQYIESAEKYKQIIIDYPEYSENDRALFNAAFAYEAGSFFIDAGREFERVYDRFPNSKIRKKSLLRAAKAFNDGKEYLRAANIFLKYKDELPADSQAVPSVFRAADMYKKSGDFVKAAKTYESVYEIYLIAKKASANGKTIYVGAAENAPGAVYTAARMYESGGHFEEAISVYKKMEQTFKKAKETPDAALSIAICYDSLRDDKKMIASYQYYLKNYPMEKAKVARVYMKMAGAHNRLGNQKEEEILYNKVIATNNEFGAKFGIDPALAAEANIILGEREFARYSKLDLITTKKGDKGAKILDSLLTKVKLPGMKIVLNYFANAIALQSREWTTKATYLAGETFWELKDKLKGQSIVEKDPYKAAYGTVKINEMLPQYYVKAMGYFYTCIDKFGNKEGIDDEWVKKSKNRFAEGFYRQAKLFLESAEILKKAPNPFPQGTEEYEVYLETLRPMIDSTRSKAIPEFVNGIEQCSKLGLTESWFYRMKKELQMLDPTNKAVAIESEKITAPVDNTGKPLRRLTKAEQDYLRAKKAIETIFNDPDMTTEQKIILLKGRENDALRKIENETKQLENIKKR